MSISSNSVLSGQPGHAESSTAKAARGRTRDIPSFGQPRHAMPGSSKALPMSEKTDGLASSFATSYAGVVAFMAVVSEGSFTKAGDRLAVGRSAVSRSVQKLETQLNARLFSRTTRSTSLTSEGERFYANCHPGVEHIVHALEDMHELRQGPPHGNLRVHSAPAFGRKIVAPLLKGFHDAYPHVTVDLCLSASAADFASDRIDVAFRSGRMEDSQIVAKRLISMQTLVCASPEYAERYGLPSRIDELEAHRCINFRLASGRTSEWKFKVGGESERVTPKAALTFNDADLVLQATLRGEGIAQLAGYQVSELLRSGQLVTCLESYAPDDDAHYLCYLSRQQLPARVRVFIDHITAQMRALDLTCPDVAAATA